MYNIISSKTLKILANEPIKFQPKGFSILSIGRLNNQKGYELAIKACKILVDKNIDVYWFVLGEGEEFKNLKNQIDSNNLNNRFILLGTRENPYPILSKVDIFVHTARFEGFGIVITEAKILSKPIVITNFNIAESHITHNDNGLISEMTSVSIAKNIEILYNDKALKNSFSKKLSSNDYGNEDEILKFYEIINN